MQWIFSKGGADTSRRMNLLNLPMKTSMACKKMQQMETPEQARGKQASNPADILKAKLLEVFPSGPSGAGSSGTQAGQSGTSGSDKGGDQPPADVKKNELKKAAFTGYQKAEKENYSTELRGLDTDDVRDLTALDEAMLALRYAAQFVKKRNAVAQADAEEDGDAEEDVDLVETNTFDLLANDDMISSFTFCVSIFYEFLWQGQAMFMFMVHEIMTSRDTPTRLTRPRHVMPVVSHATCRASHG